VAANSHENLQITDPGDPDDLSDEIPVISTAPFATATVAGRGACATVVTVGIPGTVASWRGKAGALGESEVMSEMKMIRSLLAVVCATVLFAGVASAKDTCCQKAVAAGKACEHPCCVEATKDGKICEKCNQDLKDCCKEALKAGKVCEKCNPPKKEE
jgi:hypothetical protein